MQNTQLPLVYTTSRLHWRPLQRSDEAFVYRQFSDPIMCRYFSEPPCTYAEAQDIITFYRTSTGRVWRWMLCDVHTGIPVGTCGYHYMDGERRQVEIGYDIWREYWRQGYMRDALPALIHICATTLPIDIIYALIDRDNRASLALVSQFGFQHGIARRALDTPTQACLSYVVTRPAAAAI